MNDSEKAAFSAFWLAIAERYNQTPTQASLEIDWDLLRPLDLDRIKAAVACHMLDPERGRFRPLPADIMAQVRSVALPPPEAVWAEVERAMFKHGAYMTVQFAEPAINAVIRDLGGWPWLCRQDLDEPWLRKDFCKMLADYRRCGIGLDTPLMGLFEQGNRANGYLDHVPEPIAVGPAPGRRLLQ